MSHSFRHLYSPALRLKGGELEGVRQLAGDVAQCILPRFIVPPRKERDTSTPLLIEVADVPDISAALAIHWRERPSLIDSSYILNEYGRETMSSWLPDMFDRARSQGARAIPLALLSDIAALEAPAFKAAIARDEKFKFALCVPAGEMVGPEFVANMDQVLNRLGLTPAECAVIADFGGSYFEEPEIVAPIIGGALESLQDFGLWQHVIFQGTHYPEKNPAGQSSYELWPRNEWLAWRRAVKFDPTTADHMIFGDYAADCAKMSFGASGGRAHRHLRYTTPTHWLIQRGSDSGRDADEMKKVCAETIGSSHFSGAGFSAADARILSIANRAEGPGNAKTWRQLNTTHHITQVVSDLAKVRGVEIAEGPTEVAREQFLLNV